MGKKKRRRGESGGWAAKRPSAASQPARWSYPYGLRLRAVQEVVEGGASIGDVARAFGLGRSTLVTWIRRYERSGLDGLHPVGHGVVVEAPARTPDPRREAVVAARRDHPEWGTRRIRDVLGRFAALGVSEHEVRRILHEEGLIEPAPPPRERDAAPEHRFERAAPGELWQSDIFSFLLRRHERLYLTAFLGISRNHFQTVMHRGLGGLIEGLRPGPTGRPAKLVDEEKEKLRRENTRLQDRVSTIDRLMAGRAGSCATR